MFVLGNSLLPFHRPEPKSRSADQSFPRGKYIWQQDITVSCELPLPSWGTSGGRGSMPLGAVLATKISLSSSAQVMGYKKISGASGFSLFCPCVK